MSVYCKFCVFYTFWFNYVLNTTIKITYTLLASRSTQFVSLSNLISVFRNSNSSLQHNGLSILRTNGSKTFPLRRSLFLPLQVINCSNSTLNSLYFLVNLLFIKCKVVHYMAVFLWLIFLTKEPVLCHTVPLLLSTFCIEIYCGNETMK